MTLEQWIDTSGLRSQASVARALGTTRQTVQYWCSGRSRPTLYFALAIAALTDDEVPVLTWLDQQERLAIQGLWAQVGKL